MKLKLTLLLILSVNTIFAQDSLYARHIVDTLTSPNFWGRGYTKDGVHKAADFIAGELKSFDLKPLDGKSFFQPFSYDVNTFPGTMKVAINGVNLKPGIDFIVSPESAGVKGGGPLVKSDSVTYINPDKRIVVVLQDKLTASVEQKAADYTGILVNRKSISGKPETVNADIENKLIPAFKTANICAMVRGTAKPDSFLVFTAHYDHLGGMGANTYFPGANDNASGVSQVLSLAKYYAKHPQKYSMAFICFSGEEAGLLGSKYFTGHPLIPLKNIRFLINLDLEGTGSDGITVVNATVYPKEFELLKSINAKHNYLPKINPRGKAANSDHYLFFDKGVPAIFWYTQGGIAAYHDVFDIAATLPMDHYEGIFHMILNFTDALQGKPVD